MRPSRHSMFMAMARAAASRATCFRLNVGAVVVENRNVIAVGYNGAPSGQDHCTGNGCRYFTPNGCKVIHAEVNALERVDTTARKIYAEMYCTHSPCGACASVIRINRARDLNITAVFFETAYRDPAPVQSLVDWGIEVYQCLPSGLLIDYKTGNLVEESA